MFIMLLHFVIFQIAVSLVNAREGRVEVRAKPRDSLRQNIGPRGATNLPSFKVGFCCYN